MQIEKPHRVEHTYRQHIKADPDTVFPLLCPVRETEWAEGWLPLSVISTSGVAERGCVFTTEEDNAESVWLITRHELEAGAIAFVKLTPGIVVTEIDIRLRALGKNKTEAVVSYRYTAISEVGKSFVAQRTAAWYLEFMKAWESELNAYLLQRGDGR